MFGKLMNRFYYGKSGKGDYTPEDLPKNRWELFWEMLRIRFSGLVRLNLIYTLIWIPTIVVVAIFLMMGINMINLAYTGSGTAAVTESVTVEEAASATESAAATEAAPAAEAASQSVSDQLLNTLDNVVVDSSVPDNNPYTIENLSQNLLSLFSTFLLALFPCITITGPFTAGLTYVTRNWARDEHAFIWDDFRDAMKVNWKQGLLTSLITGLLPFVTFYYAYLCSQLARTQGFFFYIPMTMVIIVFIIWSMMLIFLYPQIVTYEMRYRDMLKNSLLLAVGRLPMAFGLRLLSIVPALIACVVFFFTSSLLAPLIYGLYYILIGFALSRFTGVSYANAMLDRFLNWQIEGAEINRGLAKPEEDDADDADTAKEE